MKSELPEGATSRQCIIPLRTLKDCVMMRQVGQDSRTEAFDIHHPKFSYRRGTRRKDGEFTAGVIRSVQKTSPLIQNLSYVKIKILRIHLKTKQLVRMKWMCHFSRRFLDILLRKSEHLNYGRPMSFDKEIL